MNRRTLITTAVREARHDLVALLVRYRTSACAPGPGLVAWLETAIGYGARRVTVQGLTREVWREDVRAAALSNRFRRAQLPAPDLLLARCRLAVIGYYLAYGLTTAEIAALGRTTPKQVYRLLYLPTMGAPLRGRALMRTARAAAPAYLATVGLLPLLPAADAALWTWPALRRTGVTA